MRFVKAWIDGYGRFAQKEVDLDPGLQVLTGPNEQGKSTLRHFVGDMLYGQTRSTHQRVYDASNELRKPWNKENGYGGRLLYSIDAGRLFEVQRSFDRKDEWVRVFDRTDSIEVTSQFTTHRNREPAFADEHLHMSKAVFLNVATISHLTLEDLGNNQALTKIRSKLLSLTDSGESQTSTEGAMKWLSDRITAIGQPSARTKPLPLARARLVDLQKEYEQVRVLREEVSIIDEERLDLRLEIAHMQARRVELERQGLR